jgi:hypothetical protein
MRVNNPDVRPSESTAETQAKLPSGFAEIVGNDLPSNPSIRAKRPGYVDALAGDVRNARIVTVSLNVITESSQPEEVVEIERR